MATIPQKVFIKVESSVEQQENVKNSRRNLKVIQRSAKDKENLVGRQPLSLKAFTKSKSETEINDNEIDTKRKKLISHGCQTDSELKQALDKITEEDLTTLGEPSEAYWKTLAEKRRIALDISLKENEELHDRIANLEEELDVSRTMLDETKNLVEILTEMLDEKEKEAECSKDLLNGTISTEDGESFMSAEPSTSSSFRDDYNTPPVKDAATGIAGNKHGDDDDDDVDADGDIDSESEN